ncbi:hypothetical protein WR25_15595 [Diploscapter pachys]|uniref:G-protein coupled receptors family 2 profile 1 domain-containing protein n=1 Tax=Diploscapter pachys TaxID=2018661 RepID=A0A2A2L1L0_9BILA|nr:hypothetical protein WR25_15595 [Diploscapter pachys]
MAMSRLALSWSSLLGLLIFCPFYSFSEELYELRIHEDAEKGSRLTMGPEMQKRIEKMGGCFGQLDTDIDWVEYRSSRSAFYISTPIPTHAIKKKTDHIGILHLLCAGNKMDSIKFRVHITHRNHHPPLFRNSEMHFYVPVVAPVGSTVAHIEVTDNDPVIYNSEKTLSFTKEQKLFRILPDGSLILMENLGLQIPYRPIKMQLLAIDYGSPQLFSLANLTVTPVTVSEVKNVRVNVATEEYQIFEWDVPLHGIADKFRLAIRKGDSLIYEEEVDGRKTIAMTKMLISSADSFSYQVTAIDINGQTPSEWQRVVGLQKDVHCSGECATGGLPLCYYGPFNRLEQFSDNRGSHCLCFPGYVGVGCDRIDRCQLEENSLANRADQSEYGRVIWPEANANATVTVPCPLSLPQERQVVVRDCKWEKEMGRAVWQQPVQKDKCKSRVSLLTHLAMLTAFAENGRTVSVINTVTRFIRDHLTVPAFSQNATRSAIFEQSVANEMMKVLDSVLKTDFDSLQGNTSLAKEDVFDLVRDFSRRLPVPYSMASLTLFIKSIEWIKRAEPSDNLIGAKCRVKLPSLDSDIVVRSVCFLNGSSIFGPLDVNTPVLHLETDEAELTSFPRITIVLKWPNNGENYTCVRYDDSDNSWSIKGIRLITHNHGGFVKCETNKLGTFSVLPDRLFIQPATLVEDLFSLLPTVTTFVALICSVFLLFMAAIQKNQPIDLALLFHLFFVFMIHLAHLMMTIAPQVGEPFDFSPALHLVIQFCVLSVSATLCLVLISIHTIILLGDSSKDDARGCYTKPCHVIAIGLMLPAVLTALSYHYADDYDHDLSRLLNRVDWLFLIDYLLPTSIFFSMCIVYAVWNMYLGSNSKLHRRVPPDSYLPLNPAVNVSLSSLCMIFFLCSSLLLFALRETSLFVVFLFCCCQLCYSVSSFFFAAYLFRMRFLQVRETDGSTQSLERKRDISRALLEHVDTSKHSSSCGASSASPRSADSTAGMYISMQQNLYERAPMVSIV